MWVHCQATRTGPGRSPGAGLEGRKYAFRGCHRPSRTVASPILACVEEKSKLQQPKKKNKQVMGSQSCHNRKTRAGKAGAGGQVMGGQIWKMRHWGRGSRARARIMILGCVEESQSWHSHNQGREG